jgi:hypothetical protein
MFRFTIRELVLLTLVVAMGVAWGVDHWCSPTGQLRHRAAGMRWALESEGWVVDEHGWNVTVRKPTDKHNAYEVGLQPPSVFVLR